MAKQQIPVMAQVDVVVVGGASGGVAAAATAARAGARVFLAAPETYLGEDICATGRLWLPPDAALETALARDLFANADGQRRAPVRPMDIKRRLDTELVDAGVRFLFGCAPADILVDGRKRLAGVVFASKTGLFAVTGRVVIDATPFAALARAAGVPFTEWNGGKVVFSRVVVGHRAEGDAGTAGRLLPGPVQGEHDRKPLSLEAFEYSEELPLAGWSPAALAEAEQSFRDRTWHKDQTWSSDRAWFVPPVSVKMTGTEARHAGLESLATPVDGLFILGPCAAVPRGVAAGLMLAPRAMVLGERLGPEAAARARAAGAVRAPRPLHGAPAEAGVREGCTSVRLLNERVGTVAGGAAGSLPVIGDYDVVVAGGGTGGAPAAIAAARAGARVLLLEALSGLGGVGTLGCISSYYHGYREGFTAEVTRALRDLAGDAAFHPERWNNDHKAEWFRREVRRAGGAIWFGSIVSGAVVQGRRVQGVVVNTPFGRGLVRAGVVIDATGSADVAAAAGAECRTVSDHDLAVQGTGLPSRPFRPSYHNTDYTFVEDCDPVDVTRAFVVARRKFSQAFDLAQIVDTRERRQIVGDVTITPLDVYTGRTWHDVVCLSRSNFDSHGFTVHPIFFVLPPDRVSLDAWLPWRALLPKGWSGVAVTGLALSGQRDVMPVLRMQPDIQNHAYAVGLGAAAAAATGDLRAIDIKALQRQLVARGILPQDALLHRDRPRLPAEVVATASAGSLAIHAEIAAAMGNPARAVPVLKARLAAASAPDQRLACAKLLAVLGDASGEAILIEAAGGTWDEGWNYTGMGQFGRSLSPQDDCIVCLALLKSGAAREMVLAKAGALDAGTAFSHVRAVSVYAEATGDAAFAPVLSRVLALPGIGGHAWTTLAQEFADIPESGVDTRTRNEALRELYLARALLRCGDCEGVGRRTLQAYAHDLRGHFARHATRVLAGA